MTKALAIGALLAVGRLALLPASATAVQHPDERAEILYRRALVRFAGASADSQRSALADFEEAARLAPKRAGLWLALGRACLETGRFGRARSCLQRVSQRLDASGFDSWYELGLAWKYDWLASCERSSLEEARKCMRRAADVAPERAEGWIAASWVSLLLGRPRDALVQAGRARQIDPDGLEPLLAMASALYRLGSLSYADSAFRAADPRIPGELRAWFAGELPSSVAADEGADRDSTDAIPAETFRWQDSDPDLTTPENEARLDYLTRLSLALFLFREGGKVRWDRRAELFVRYGPPASIEYNPAWAQLGSNGLAYQYPRHVHVMYAPDPIPFPYNMQVWHYPDLGMDVTLWDRSLTRSYDYPYSEDRPLEPQPDPALLEASHDLVALQGGRGVFRAMAPGTRPLDVRAAVNRFPSEHRVRLLAHVFAPGQPSDSLWGSWAVADQEGRVLFRASGRLSVSACDPGAEQVADFVATVPPGDYRVDLAVQGAGSRRGVAHLRSHVGPPPETLAMSDLVLLCGASPSPMGSENLQIAPDVERRVSGSRSIAVYYEIDRLAAGSDGVGHFRYTCSIRPIPKAGHKRSRELPILYEATREEENIGPHRRQFVTVPAISLPAGTYEMRMDVRDLVSGADAQATITFTKDGPLGSSKAERQP